MAAEGSTDDGGRRWRKHVNLRWGYALVICGSECGIDEGKTNESRSH